MLKTTIIYALCFAGVAVVYEVVKSAIQGEELSIDPGLVVTLAVTGAIGGLISAKRAKK